MSPLRSVTGEQRVFRIRGMDCAEEVAILKDVVGPLVGGADRLGFDILNGRMTVSAGVDIEDPALKAAVSKTGMQAERWKMDQGRTPADARVRRVRLTLTVASGVLTFLGFVLHALIAGSVAAALGSEGAGLAHDVRGGSDVDQASITGESVPVSKQAGDAVFAGTINGHGALEIESTKAAGDTTLAHIIQLVGDAQARRAPSELWVERFARVYTPAIFTAAVAVALAPPLLFDASWSAWAYRALVLLVIGCPCALVISTPVKIVAALASAARNGIVIKGGVFVEAPARLKAIALDKTGTLAMGVAGSDTAIETADIALMADDLRRIPWLIEHSRRATAIIRQNISLSLAVKAIFVALTFAGRASLWAAIGADMGVTLLVVANALRLLRAGGMDAVERPS